MSQLGAKPHSSNRLHATGLQQQHAQAYVRETEHLRSHRQHCCRRQCCAQRYRSSNLPCGWSALLRCAPQQFVSCLHADVLRNTCGNPANFARASATIGSAFAAQASHVVRCMLFLVHAPELRDVHANTFHVPWDVHAGINAPPCNAAGAGVAALTLPRPAAQRLALQALHLQCQSARPVPRMP